MALRHYELASTTVTGIPMKEEQNASSSANYDVELFHKASAHWRLLSDYHDREGEGSTKLKNEDLSAMMPQTQKEGFRYNTITLKWCTPRGSSADLHPCTALARVTPTDVNSRPSSCLTNFLLSGRSVMLEMPRRSGTKILSHMVSHWYILFCVFTCLWCHWPEDEILLSNYQTIHPYFLPFLANIPWRWNIHPYVEHIEVCTWRASFYQWRSRWKGYRLQGKIFYLPLSDA